MKAILYFYGTVPCFGVSTIKKSIFTFLDKRGKEELVYTHTCVCVCVCVCVCGCIQVNWVWCNALECQGRVYIILCIKEACSLKQVSPVCQVEANYKTWRAHYLDLATCFLTGPLIVPDFPVHSLTSVDTTVYWKEGIN